MTNNPLPGEHGKKGQSPNDNPGRKQYYYINPRNIAKAGRCALARRGPIAPYELHLWHQSPKDPRKRTHQVEYAFHTYDELIDEIRLLERNGDLATLDWQVWGHVFEQGYYHLY